MGFYIPPQQTNIFSNIVGKIKNAFAPKLPSYPGAGPGAPGTPKFYQVQEQDTSMDTVANNLQLPLPQLVAANNGIKSLPPKGSFIQTQPDLPGTPPTDNPLYNMIQQQGVAPQPGATMGAGSFVSGAGQVNFTELNANIQQQVAQGVLPQEVSFFTPIINPTTGQAVTDAEMIANGYTYDNLKKSWKLNATGDAGGTAAAAVDKPDPYSEVKSIFISKNRGYVTPEVADLIMRRRRARRRRGPVRPSDNAGGTPGSVLDTQLGSG